MNQMATDGMEQAASYDLVVVGGGINGVGIARDAVGRGLSVLLCERDDLASHTSSASTKLIHGGLRYLEQYEFALVGKALAEREVLLRAAPHIIWPLRFILPHQPHLRPAWMIRIGLFLYDWLGGRRGRTLADSKSVDLRTDSAGGPLRREFVKGFAYSDAWVQDARLVVLNAMDAAARGATILTRTACIAARREADGWTVDLRLADGSLQRVHARALANAAGPWAVNFLDDIAHIPHSHALRLVKGSHIVVRQIYAHHCAYIFQQPDRRIIFAIPFEHEFTLIGTTDIDFHGDPTAPHITQEEITYLCEAASRYFKAPVNAQDVIWNYSGVRPLLGDENDSASEVTRDYLLDVDTKGAPLLNVFGGKLTTFRRLGEEAVDHLASLLGNEAPAWTASSILPGGDLPGGHFDAFALAFSQRHAWMPGTLALRLCRQYGTRAEKIVDGATAPGDLGECLGADLYTAEVDYLIEHEWATTSEDILWRRSKLGLHFDAAAVGRLNAYIARRAHAGAQA
jgi:glycerol-3-phosphate dehydrogenase